jgi:hypothetical protein
MTSARPRKPAAQQGVHVTLMDVDLLRRLIRFQGTTAPVLMRHVYTGQHRSGIYARLARLVRAGLLEDLSTGPSNLGRPRNIKALYVPTRLAYRMLESSLGHKSISLGTTLHTVAVSEVGLEWERRGWTVVSDREILHEITVWRTSEDCRSFDSDPWLGEYDGTGLSAIENLKRKRVLATHRPDLVLVDDRDDGNGGRIAVEVELTMKSPARLLHIMRWYARESKFSKVRYYVPDRAAASRVRGQVAKLPDHQQDMFEVRWYEPLHSIEPLPEVRESPFGEVGDLPVLEGGSDERATSAVQALAPVLPESTGLPSPTPATAGPGGPELPGGLPTRRPAVVPAAASAAAGPGQPLPAKRGWPGAPGAPGMWDAPTDEAAPL